jgi:hypothetical protein
MAINTKTKTKITPAVKETRPDNKQITEITAINKQLMAKITRTVSIDI